MLPRIQLLCRSLVALVLVGLFSPRAHQNMDASTTLQPVPADFFGMHIHRIATTTAWPAVSFAEWRLWDAYVAWPSLEPHKGQWHFEVLDKYVALAEAHHVALLLPLGLSPQWASARPMEKSTYQPGNAAEPRNIEDWRNYVRVVASRYKGRIHEYEIWNEPNLKMFWTGDVDQMIVLTREAAQIIRAIDPNATIVSPAATTMNGVPWLREFLSKGGGQDVDVIGFHLYVTPQPPEAMVPLIHEVQRAMRENGAADKPLWDTETGWAGPKPFPSPELAASYLVRAEILAWANGVRRLYWYSWDNHGWVTLQTTEADNRTLTFAGKAYSTAQDWMIGARIQNCGEQRSGVWSCALERNGYQKLIAWSPSGDKAFDLGANAGPTTVTTLLGESRLAATNSLEVGPMTVLISPIGK